MERKCVAVCIGVRDFEEPGLHPLPGAAQDAGRMADLLRTPEAGYLTTLVADVAPRSTEFPRRAAILSRLETALREADDADVLLVYLATHGLAADDGEAYLMTADSRRNVLSDTALAVSDLKRRLASCGAKAKVCLLDACHADATREAERGCLDFGQLARDAAGTAVLGACAFDEKARELETGEGVFTHYLIRALQGEVAADRNGAVTVSSVFGYVRERVQEWAAVQSAIQTPTLNASQVGDIPIIIRPHEAQESERLAGTLSGLMFDGKTTLYGKPHKLTSDDWLHDHMAGIRAKLLPTWPLSVQFLHRKGDEIRVGLNDGYIGLQWCGEEPQQWGRYPDDFQRGVVVRCAILRPGPDAPERLAAMVAALEQAEIEPADPKLYAFWSGDIDGDLLGEAVTSVGFCLDKLYDGPGPRIEATRTAGGAPATLVVSKHEGQDWCAILSFEGHPTANCISIAEDTHALWSLLAAGSGELPEESD